MVTPATAPEPVDGGRISSPQPLPCRQSYPAAALTVSQKESRGADPGGGCAVIPASGALGDPELMRCGEHLGSVTAVIGGLLVALWMEMPLLRARSGVGSETEFCFISNPSARD
jgi:hypothetical protein